MVNDISRTSCDQLLHSASAEAYIGSSGVDSGVLNIHHAAISHLQKMRHLVFGERPLFSLLLNWDLSACANDERKNADQQDDDHTISGSNSHHIR